MKLFLDSCDKEEISYFKKLGLVDGVTTNPSIIAKSGQDIFKVIESICEVIGTSVSVEVISQDCENMLKEAAKFCNIGPQITVKLPITEDGLQACHILSQQDVSVNLTLCFSPTQALLAAKVGAEYVSPFIGRLDDVGHFGMEVIADICAIYENYPELSTKIIAASIRSPIHIIEAAKMGVDVATVPPSLLKKLITHPLTSQGLDIFLQDWKNSKMLAVI